jgi:predicted hydrocarbon binding protein
MSQDREMPNAALRRLLLSVEEVMGVDRMRDMLNHPGLSQYAGNYPPDDLEYGASFSLYGQIEQAIEDLYGPRGAPAILLRVGRETFHIEMKAQPTGIVLAGQALKSMPFIPQPAKMRLLLRQMVRATNKTLNQPARLEEDADGFMIVMDHCMCEYRPPHRQPCCLVTLGAFDEAIKWLTGKPFDVQEITCINIGADACRYRIAKQQDK